MWRAGRESNSREPVQAHPAAPSQAVLFEVAWEVCNQVGGIYQVLRSKAPIMVDRWRQRYCLVGPYLADTAALEFEKLRTSGWMGNTVARLAEQGLVAHHGRWLVSGRPRVVLLEHQLMRPRLEQVRERLRQDHGIDVSSRDPLVEEVIAFGEAVRLWLEAACDEWCTGARRNDRRVLAHFHEWLGGLALPMLRHGERRLATVFTTHATQVGRYSASGEPDFYERLPRIDADKEAARYGIGSQHRIERACAKSCHLMTARPKW
jgi:glycogen(starch) synthase